MLSVKYIKEVESSKYRSEEITHVRGVGKVMMGVKLHNCNKNLQTFSIAEFEKA